MGKKFLFVSSALLSGERKSKGDAVVVLTAAWCGVWIFLLLPLVCGAPGAGRQRQP